MKLAEALLERADLQKRLSQMSGRLERSAVIQEGEEPPEDPQTLLKEMKRIFKKLEELVAKIQTANASTDLEPYGKLSDALVKRDLLMQKRQMLQTLADQASIVEARYSMSEIRRVPTVSVRKIQKEIDEISKEYRLLDTKVQQANWLTEIE
ncbi:MAG: DIP1984 family protein [Bacillota bacterium]